MTNFINHTVTYNGTPTLSIVHYLGKLSLWETSLGED